MNNTQVRSESEILRDLQQVSTKNTPGSIVKIQLGEFQRPRRTTPVPYISNYKGNAIITIPYGPDNFEFSFSVRKGLAIHTMCKTGDFQKLLLKAMDLQEKLDAEKTPRQKVSDDIIDLG